MRMSEQIGELAAALSAAQAMMKGAEKDGANPFFKSSYSTFAAVVEALREPFAKNKLAYSQPTRAEADGSTTVETIIMHASGQWIAGEITAKPVKNDPQGVGSLVSYLKRYELQAMSGLPSKDDDDDANIASGKGAPAGKPQGVAAKAPAPNQPEAFEIPFGPNGGDPVYMELPEEKKYLAKILKAKGVTSPVHMQLISKDLAGKVWIENLGAAIDEWFTENKLTTP